MATAREVGHAWARGLWGDGEGSLRAARLAVPPALNPPALSTGLRGPSQRRRQDGQVKAASPWAGTVIRDVGTQRAGGGGVLRTFQNKWPPPSGNFPPLELGQKGGLSEKSAQK